MLSKVIGVIWIILGAVWLTRPEILKARLRKKMSRKIRLIVYGFIMVFGFLLIGSVIKAHGFLPKIIGLVGMIITIKAILLITSRTSERVLAWWAEKPLTFFRIWGLFILVIGLMLMFV